jgi:hypothetical protein
MAPEKGERSNGVYGRKGESANGRNGDAAKGFAGSKSWRGAALARALQPLAISYIASLTRKRESKRLPGITQRDVSPPFP